MALGTEHYIVRSALIWHLVYVLVSSVVIIVVVGFIRVLSLRVILIHTWFLETQLFGRQAVV